MKRNEIKLNKNDSREKDFWQETQGERAQNEAQIVDETAENAASPAVNLSTSRQREDETASRDGTASICSVKSISVASTGYLSDDEADEDYIHIFNSEYSFSDKENEEGDHPSIRSFRWSSSKQSLTSLLETLSEEVPVEATVTEHEEAVEETKDDEFEILEFSAFKDDMISEHKDRGLREVGLKSFDITKPEVCSQITEAGKYSNDVAREEDGNILLGTEDKETAGATLSEDHNAELVQEKLAEHEGLLMEPVIEGEEKYLPESYRRYKEKQRTTSDLIEEDESTEILIEVAEYDNLEAFESLDGENSMEDKENEGVVESKRRIGVMGIPLLQKAFPKDEFDTKEDLNNDLQINVLSKEEDLTGMKEYIDILSTMKHPYTDTGQNVEQGDEISQLENLIHADELKMKCLNEDLVEDQVAELETERVNLCEMELPVECEGIFVEMMVEHEEDDLRENCLRYEKTQRKTLDCIEEDEIREILVGIKEHHDEASLLSLKTKTVVEKTNKGSEDRGQQMKIPLSDICKEDLKSNSKEKRTKDLRLPVKEEGHSRIEEYVKLEEGRKSELNDYIETKGPQKQHSNDAQEEILEDLDNNCSLKMKKDERQDLSFMEKHLSGTDSMSNIPFDISKSKKDRKVEDTTEEYLNVTMHDTHEEEKVTLDSTEEVVDCEGILAVAMIECKDRDLLESRQHSKGKQSNIFTLVKEELLNEIHMEKEESHSSTSLQSNEDENSIDNRIAEDQNKRCKKDLPASDALYELKQSILESDISFLPETMPKEKIISMKASNQNVSTFQLCKPWFPGEGFAEMEEDVPKINESFEPCILKKEASSNQETNCNKEGREEIEMKIEDKNEMKHRVEQYLATNLRLKIGKDGKEASTVEERELVYESSVKNNASSKMKENEKSIKSNEDDVDITVEEVIQIDCVPKQSEEENQIAVSSTTENLESKKLGLCATNENFESNEEVHDITVEEYIEMNSNFKNQVEYERKRSNESKNEKRISQFNEKDRGCILVEEFLEFDDDSEIAREGEIITERCEKRGEMTIEEYLEQHDKREDTEDSEDRDKTTIQIDTILSKVNEDLNASKLIENEGCSTDGNAIFNAMEANGDYGKSTERGETTIEEYLIECLERPGSEAIKAEKSSPKIEKRLRTLTTKDEYKSKSGPNDEIRSIQKMNNEGFGKSTYIENKDCREYEGGKISSKEEKMSDKAYAEKDEITVEEYLEYCSGNDETLRMTNTADNKRSACITIEGNQEESIVESSKRETKELEEASEARDEITVEEYLEHCSENEETLRMTDTADNARSACIKIEGSQKEYIVESSKKETKELEIVSEERDEITVEEYLEYCSENEETLRMKGTADNKRSACIKIEGNQEEGIVESSKKETKELEEASEAGDEITVEEYLKYCSGNVETLRMTDTADNKWSACIKIEGNQEEGIVESSKKETKELEIVSEERDEITVEEYLEYCSENEETLRMKGTADNKRSACIKIEGNQEEGIVESSKKETKELEIVSEERDEITVEEYLEYCSENEETLRMKGTADNKRSACITIEGNQEEGIVESSKKETKELEEASEAGDEITVEEYLKYCSGNVETLRMTDTADNKWSACIKIEGNQEEGIVESSKKETKELEIVSEERDEITVEEYLEYCSENEETLRMKGTADNKRSACIKIEGNQEEGIVESSKKETKELEIVSEERDEITVEEYLEYCSENEETLRMKGTADNKRSACITIEGNQEESIVESSKQETKELEEASEAGDEMTVEEYLEYCSENEENLRMTDTADNKRSACITIEGSQEESIVESSKKETKELEIVSEERDEITVEEYLEYCSENEETLRMKGTADNKKSACIRIEGNQEEGIVESSKKETKELEIVSEERDEIKVEEYLEYCSENEETLRMKGTADNKRSACFTIEGNQEESIVESSKQETKELEIVSEAGDEITVEEYLEYCSENEENLRMTDTADNKRSACITIESNQEESIVESSKRETKELEEASEARDEITVEEYLEHCSENEETLRMTDTADNARSACIKIEGNQEEGIVESSKKETKELEIVSEERDEITVEEYLEYCSENEETLRMKGTADNKRSACFTIEGNQEESIVESSKQETKELEEASEAGDEMTVEEYLEYCSENEENLRMTDTADNKRSACITIEGSQEESIVESSKQETKELEIVSEERDEITVEEYLEYCSENEETLRMKGTADNKRSACIKIEGNQEEGIVESSKKETKELEIVSEERDEITVEEYLLICQNTQVKKDLNSFIGTDEVDKNLAKVDNILNASGKKEINRCETDNEPLENEDDVKLEEHLMKHAFQQTYDKESKSVASNGLRTRFQVTAVEDSRNIQHFESEFEIDGENLNIEARHDESESREAEMDLEIEISEDAQQSKKSVEMLDGTFDCKANSNKETHVRNEGSEDDREDESNPQNQQENGRSFFAMGRNILASIFDRQETATDNVTDSLQESMVKEKFAGSSESKAGKKELLTELPMPENKFEETLQEQFNITTEEELNENAETSFECRMKDKLQNKFEILFDDSSEQDENKEHSKGNKFEINEKQKDDEKLEDISDNTSGCMLKGSLDDRVDQGPHESEKDKFQNETVDVDDNLNTVLNQENETIVDEMRADPSIEERNKTLLEEDSSNDNATVVSHQENDTMVDEMRADPSIEERNKTLLEEDSSSKNTTVVSHQENDTMVDEMRADPSIEERNKTLLAEDSSNDNATLVSYQENDTMVDEIRTDPSKEQCNIALLEEDSSSGKKEFEINKDISTVAFDICEKGNMSSSEIGSSDFHETIQHRGVESKEDSMNAKTLYDFTQRECCENTFLERIEDSTEVESSVKEGDRILSTFVISREKSADLDVDIWYNEEFNNKCGEISWAEYQEGSFVPMRKEQTKQEVAPKDEATHLTLEIRSGLDSTKPSTIVQHGSKVNEVKWNNDKENSALKPKHQILESNDDAPIAACGKNEANSKEAEFDVIKELNQESDEDIFVDALEEIDSEIETNESILRIRDSVAILPSSETSKDEKQELLTSFKTAEEEDRRKYSFDKPNDEKTDNQPKDCVDFGLKDDDIYLPHSGESKGGWIKREDLGVADCAVLRSAETRLSAQLQEGNYLPTEVGLSNIYNNEASMIPSSSSELEGVSGDFSLSSSAKPGFKGFESYNTSNDKKELVLNADVHHSKFSKDKSNSPIDADEIEFWTGKQPCLGIKTNENTDFSLADNKNSLEQIQNTPEWCLVDRNLDKQVTTGQTFSEVVFVSPTFGSQSGFSCLPPVEVLEKPDKTQLQTDEIEGRVETSSIDFDFQRQSRFQAGSRIRRSPSKIYITAKIESIDKSKDETNYLQDTSCDGVSMQQNQTFPEITENIDVKKKLDVKVKRFYTRQKAFDKFSFQYSVEEKETAGEAESKTSMNRTDSEKLDEQRLQKLEIGTHPRVLTNDISTDEPEVGADVTVIYGSQGRIKTNQIRQGSQESDTADIDSYVVLEANDRPGVVEENYDRSMAAEDSEQDIGSKGDGAHDQSSKNRTRYRRKRTTKSDRRKKSLKQLPKRERQQSEENDTDVIFDAITDLDMDAFDTGMDTAFDSENEREARSNESFEEISMEFRNTEAELNRFGQLNSGDDCEFEMVTKPSMSDNGTDSEYSLAISEDDSVTVVLGFDKELNALTVAPTNLVPPKTRSGYSSELEEEAEDENVRERKKETKKKHSPPTNSDAQKAREIDQRIRRGHSNMDSNGGQLQEGSEETTAVDDRRGGDLEKGKQQKSVSSTEDERHGSHILEYEVDWETAFDEEKSAVVIVDPETNIIKVGLRKGLIKGSRVRERGLLQTDLTTSAEKEDDSSNVGKLTKKMGTSIEEMSVVFMQADGKEEQKDEEVDRVRGRERENEENEEPRQGENLRERRRQKDVQLEEDQDKIDNEPRQECMRDRRRREQHNSSDEEPRQSESLRERRRQKDVQLEEDQDKIDSEPRQESMRDRRRREQRNSSDEEPRQSESLRERRRQKDVQLEEDQDKIDNEPRQESMRDRRRREQHNSSDEEPRQSESLRERRRQKGIQLEEDQDKIDNEPRQESMRDRRRREQHNSFDEEPRQSESLRERRRQKGIQLDEDKDKIDNELKQESMRDRRRREQHNSSDEEPRQSGNLRERRKRRERNNEESDEDNATHSTKDMNDIEEPSDLPERRQKNEKSTGDEEVKMQKSDAEEDEPKEGLRRRKEREPKPKEEEKEGYVENNSIKNETQQHKNEIQGKEKSEEKVTEKEESISTPARRRQRERTYPEDDVAMERQNEKQKPKERSTTNEEETNERESFMRSRRMAENDMNLELKQRQDVDSIPAVRRRREHNNGKNEQEEDVLIAERDQSLASSAADINDDDINGRLPSRRRERNKVEDSKETIALSDEGSKLADSEDNLEGNLQLAERKRRGRDDDTTMEVVQSKDASGEVEQERLDMKREEGAIGDGEKNKKVLKDEKENEAMHFSKENAKENGKQKNAGNLVDGVQKQEEQKIENTRGKIVDLQENSNLLMKREKDSAEIQQMSEEAASRSEESLKRLADDRRLREKPSAEKSSNASEEKKGNETEPKEGRVEGASFNREGFEPSAQKADEDMNCNWMSSDSFSEGRAAEIYAIAETMLKKNLPLDHKLERSDWQDHIKLRETGFIDDEIVGKSSIHEKITMQNAFDERLLKDAEEHAYWGRVLEIKRMRRKSVQMSKEMAKQREEEKMTNENKESGDEKRVKMNSEEDVETEKDEMVGGSSDEKRRSSENGEICKEVDDYPLSEKSANEIEESEKNAIKEDSIGIVSDDSTSMGCEDQTDQSAISAKKEEKSYRAKSRKKGKIRPGDESEKGASKEGVTKKVPLIKITEPSTEAFFESQDLEIDEDDEKFIEEVLKQLEKRKQERKKQRELEEEEPVPHRRRSWESEDSDDLVDGKGAEHNDAESSFTKTKGRKKNVSRSDESDERGFEELEKTIVQQRSSPEKGPIREVMAEEDEIMSNNKQEKVEKSAISHDFETSTPRLRRDKNEEDFKKDDAESLAKRRQRRKADVAGTTEKRDEEFKDKRQDFKEMISDSLIANYDEEENVDEEIKHMEQAIDAKLGRMFQGFDDEEDNKSIRRKAKEDGQVDDIKEERETIGLRRRAKMKDEDDNERHSERKSAEGRRNHQVESDNSESEDKPRDKEMKADVGKSRRHRKENMEGRPETEHKSDVEEVSNDQPSPTKSRRSRREKSNDNDDIQEEEISYRQRRKDQETNDINEEEFQQLRRRKEDTIKGKGDAEENNKGIPLSDFHEDSIRRPNMTSTMQEEETFSGRRRDQQVNEIQDKEIITKRSRKEESVNGIEDDEDSKEWRNESAKGETSEEETGRGRGRRIRHDSNNSIKTSHVENEEKGVTEARKNKNRNAEEEMKSLRRKDRRDGRDNYFEDTAEVEEDLKIDRDSMHKQEEVEEIDSSMTCAVGQRSRIEGTRQEDEEEHSRMRRRKGRRDRGDQHSEDAAETEEDLKRGRKTKKKQEVVEERDRSMTSAVGQRSRSAGEEDEEEQPRMQRRMGRRDKEDQYAEDAAEAGTDLKRGKKNKQKQEEDEERDGSMTGAVGQRIRSAVEEDEEEQQRIQRRKGRRDREDQHAGDAAEAEKDLRKGRKNKQKQEEDEERDGSMTSAVGQRLRSAGEEDEEEQPRIQRRKGRRDREDQYAEDAVEEEMNEIESSMTSAAVQRSKSESTRDKIEDEHPRMRRRKGKEEEKDANLFEQMQDKKEESEVSDRKRERRQKEIMTEGNSGDDRRSTDQNYRSDASEDGAGRRTSTEGDEIKQGLGARKRRAVDKVDDERKLDDVRTANRTRRRGQEEQTPLSEAEEEAGPIIQNRTGRRREKGNDSASYEEEGGNEITTKEGSENRRRRQRKYVEDVTEDQSEGYNHNRLSKSEMEKSYEEEEKKDERQIRRRAKVEEDVMEDQLLSEVKTQEELEDEVEKGEKRGRKKKNYSKDEEDPNLENFEDYQPKGNEEDFGRKRAKEDEDVTNDSYRKSRRQKEEEEREVRDKSRGRRRRKESESISKDESEIVGTEDDRLENVRGTRSTRGSKKQSFDLEDKPKYENRRNRKRSQRSSSEKEEGEEENINRLDNFNAKNREDRRQRRPGTRREEYPKDDYEEVIGIPRSPSSRDSWKGDYTSRSETERSEAESEASSRWLGKQDLDLTEEDKEMIGRRRRSSSRNIWRSGDERSETESLERPSKRETSGRDEKALQNRTRERGRQRSIVDDLETKQAVKKTEHESRNMKPEKKNLNEKAARPKEKKRSPESKEILPVPNKSAKLEQGSKESIEQMVGTLRSSSTRNEWKQIQEE